MMMSKVVQAASIALALLAALLVGCERDGSATGGATTGPSGKGGKPLVVGFAQVGAESAWRTANTQSIQDEAKKRGIDLRFSDAQGKQENQIAAVRGFIAQRVDVILLAPIVETGFEPVLREAKAAGIPVILSDRRVATDDPSLYVTFIGSDFVEEGRRAAQWLAKETGGKATIAELQGTTGSAPANDRKKGFEEVIAKHPDMKIVLSQTGKFERAEGKKVMEAFLKTPQGKDINALYAHNDDMAIGAIQAIEEAGRKPGTDILIVSVDGVRAAFEAMAEGKLNCTVECNPLIGPQIFDAVEKIVAGEPVPKHIEVEEGVFTQEQAKAELPNRKY
ncbi:MAG TPA: ABC transporter substrate-binding protein [Tepidisphaeraceae bacterium]|nr:ABC transporter substrate-binding protein [Tepidisphaeraceae bacterium]